MLTRRVEPHRHSYTKLGYIREFGTVRRTNEIIRDVESRTIDRIILTRTCSCGASQAFTCGPRDEMRQLYAQLTGGKP